MTDEILQAELDTLLDKAEQAIGAYREAISSVCSDLSSGGPEAQEWALDALESMLSQDA